MLLNCLFITLNTGKVAYSVDTSNIWIGLSNWVSSSGVFGDFKFFWVHKLRSNFETLNIRFLTSSNKWFLPIFLKDLWSL